MARVVLTVLIVAAIAGFVYFYWHYQVETHYDNNQLAWVKITPRAAGTGLSLPWQSGQLPAARPLRPTFRIASFHVDALDDHKLADRRVLDVLLRVLPQFELIAIQGFRGASRGEVLRLVEMLNATSGRQYDFAASPLSGRGGAGPYMAFVFDQTAIELDRSTLRSVDGPPGSFRDPPLAAQFRVRGPKENEAFTFQLISVAVDPEHAADELRLLADVYRAVRDDGRNEDDIIMLGDFTVEESRLGPLTQRADMAAITAMPTTVRGTRRADNILFNRRATTEYTGRAEPMDIMRECDLTIEQALEVSEHLPIWAELSAFEGGQTGLMPQSTP
jgi:deoxyribonuclease-1-like protein